MTFSHIFVRRGLEAGINAVSKPHHGDGDDQEKPINPIALLVITLTLIFFAFVLFAVSI